MEMKRKEFMEKLKGGMLIPKTSTPEEQAWLDSLTVEQQADMTDAYLKVQRANKMAVRISYEDFQRWSAKLAVRFKNGRIPKRYKPIEVIGKRILSEDHRDKE